MSEKITNCKVCNAEIAKNAKNCPACGAKNKKPFFKKPIFWILIVFVILIAVISGSGSSNSSIDYSKPDASVSADEIINAYGANSVTADETYKNKVIKVKGKISTISEYTIYLKGDEEDNWLTSVDCSLASGQDDIIKSIVTDSYITIVGVCKSTGLTGDVKIEDAKILADSITTQKPITVPEDAKEVIEISVDELLKEYDKNSVAADDAFKGKTLKIKGKIQSIEDDHIIFSSSDDWDFTTVYAYYVSGTDVKSFTSGQVITATGTCSGKDMFSDVKLSDCSFSK